MIHSLDIDSHHLGLTRRVTVWLPPSARGRGAAPHPVLYLHDGQNLFDPARAFAGQTWRVAETLTRLVRRPSFPALIVVGIDHGASLRAREYLPVADDRNTDASGPVMGRAHAAFVTREVMPAIARQFPVASGPSQTGIGGSSYGAVAALYTTLINPGVFGHLLLESPSLYVGGQYLLRSARRAQRWPRRVYLGVGTAETSREEWNVETVANVQALAATLQRAALGPRRLLTVIEEGATHSEGAWAGRLPRALEFLFGDSGIRVAGSGSR